MSFHVRWKRWTRPSSAGRYGTGVSCFAWRAFTSASTTAPFSSGVPSITSSLIGP
ncbi:hypothetical protein PF001_g33069 [Phytophthora fragariae]|uniref:Uncharacterized protein n=1 Tax=Phytophthora fragariae TaxID=53985 RepID=A0A6A4ALB4_9STRA|nr:hypothetical protein PF001_g33069 [Phytophthora fragariae]